MNLVYALALMAAGLMLFGLGAWLLLKSRMPTWCRGIWKWPLGDNLSPTVARLMGWSALLVGVACGPMAVMIAVWDRSTFTWVAAMAAMAAMFLSGAGLFPWAWSVSLSHGRPTDLRAG